MNLKFMKAKELDNRIKGLFKKECDLLHEVLVTIQEISRRRLHEEFGYTSVYTYLTQEVGYSEGTAYRHIQAAKLLEDVPEVAIKIQTGEISLAQMSLLQKAVKVANERSNVEVSKAQKVEIIEQIANKPVYASEKLVAQILDIPVVKNNHLKPQADESVLATLSIPKEIFDKIEQAQCLVSHSLESKDLVKFLEYAADLIIKQKALVRVFKDEKSTDQESDLAVVVSDKEVLADENFSQESLHVAAKALQTWQNKDVKLSAKLNPQLNSQPFTNRQRKIILQRDKCCQHRDPKTHKLCRSQWQLQVDHRISRWAGGESRLENAQVLCGVHNRRKYQQESGVRRL